MAIRPESPQTIGGVLDTTFQLYKASLPKVWLLCLVFGIVSSLPAFFLPSDPTAMIEAVQGPMFWVIYVITLFVTLWLLAALYLLQHAIGADEELSIGSAITAGAGRALPYLLMSILFALALALGLVLLIIPGLILTVSLMLGTNLLVLEGQGPVASLRGSHALVWGNWWRSAAILTVGFIILMVVYVAAGFLIGLIMPFTAPTNAADMLTTANIAGTAIGVVGSIVLTPFFVALLIALYWDLKLRKEGGDLAARVGALNAA